MPNPYGLNGRPQQQVPADEALYEILFLWQRLGYTIPQQLKKLEEEFNYLLSDRSFRRLRERLEVPTARLARKMDQEQLKEAVQSVIGLGGEDAFRQAENVDSNGLGVRRTRDHLAVEKGLIVSHSLVRTTLQEVDPEGLECRWPGWRRPHRAVLDSKGYAEEWCADGHEKLADRGLGFGPSVSFEIYGIKDKFSGFFVALQCVPNARDRATVAHVYLDAVEREGGCPRKFVVDCGTETNGAIEAQVAFRQVFAPEVDLEEYPPYARVRSVHNTVIEGAWSKFGREEGRLLRDLIQEHESEVDLEDETSLLLFRWVWSQIIQKRLDCFLETHNTSRVRSQPKKKMPSGHIPIRAKLGEMGGINCLVPVPKEAVQQLRAKYDAPLQFVDPEFDAMAQDVYRELGSPLFTRSEGWAIFFAMLEKLSV